MNRIYPYNLKPTVVPAIWGGDALVKRYGKPGNPDEHLGESWECWNENSVENGDLAGSTVAELVKTNGAGLLGLIPVTDRSSFPVLTKIIDARESLSVQVHPDDAYANRVEHQPNGKTECWVILEAQPKAELILGFSRDTDATEFKRKAADGTLGDMLRHVPVKAGDVFHLPAGTLHAIGAGIVLFETQQTSNITYRAFDWNRVDASGKGRELHIDRAADVLDFRMCTRSTVEPLEYFHYGTRRRLLIADKRFGVEEILLGGPCRYLMQAAALSITAQSEPISVIANNITAQVAAWSTVLIPAGASRIEIDSEKATSIFAVTPPGADVRARERLESSNIGAEAISRFLAQFDDVERAAASS